MRRTAKVSFLGQKLLEERDVEMSKETLGCFSASWNKSKISRSTKCTRHLKR